MVEYAPGPWAAVLGRSMWVLLSARLDEPVVSRLWELCADGGDELGVLAALSGSQSVVDFAVASYAQDAGKLVVGGAAVAVVTSADGAEEVVRADGPAWQVRALASAVSLRLSTADPSGVVLPVGHGVVAASAVTVGLATPRPVPLARASAPAPVPAAVAVPPPADPVPDGPAFPAYDGLLVEHSVARNPTDSPAFFTRQEPQVVQSAQAPPRSLPPHAPRPGAGMLLDDQISDFALAAAPGARRIPPADARTVLRAGRPAAPAPARGLLRLPDGEIVRLERDVLFGREPGGPSGPLKQIVRVRVADVSAQHAEVRLDGGHVLVVDLGSSNGTDITPPGGQPFALSPHTPLEIAPGTAVALSPTYRFTYEVTT